MDEMRGHDYRSEKLITLIIGKQFKCRRDRQQAMTRVGRFYDECVRYETEQVKRQPQDPRMHAKHVTAINSFVNDGPQCNPGPSQATNDKLEKALITALKKCEK